MAVPGRAGHIAWKSCQPRRGTVKPARISGRRFSSCSARPATWPSAWCCRPFTGWPWTGCCRGSGGSWATAAARSRTRTSARHVHNALTEFGPQPDKGAWDAFSQRVFFAGGGFTSDSPGSLLDVLGKGRESLGGDPQLVHYLAVPPVAFGETTKALGQHGLAHERPGGVREAVRHVGGRTSASWTRSSIRSSTSSRSTGSTISSARKRRRTCTCCASPTGCSPRAGTASTSSRCRSTCPRRSASATGLRFYDATGAVLDMLVTHLFQVAAEVAMEPPASLGALDLQAAREKVISCFRPLDPRRGGARPVRRLPRRTRGGGHAPQGHVRRRPAVDRQSDRWRGVPFYLRTGKRLAASRQRVSLILREPPGPLAGQLPRDANVLSFSLAGDGEIDLFAGGQEARPGAGPRRRPRVDPAGQPARRGSAAAVRPADPRRADRRPLAVHPPGRAGRGLEGGRAAAVQPAPDRAVRARILGPDEARDLIAPGHWLLGQ